VVRWLTQRDIVTVVKAKSPDNLKANLAVFDFELTFEDCDKIKVLNSRAMRICEDPNDTKH
jgi:diketogulonate reductase-like aldo/keto reductase